jgi:hypothetical protein
MQVLDFAGVYPLGPALVKAIFVHLVNLLLLLLRQLQEIRMVRVLGAVGRFGAVASLSPFSTRVCHEGPRSSFRFSEPSASP